MIILKLKILLICITQINIKMINMYFTEENKGHLIKAAVPNQQEQIDHNVE